MLFLALAALLSQGILFRNLNVALAMKSGFGVLLPPGTVKRAKTAPAFPDAVVECLCYSRGGTSIPGQHRSPAGGYRFRLAFSVVVMVTVAFALHTCAINRPSPLPDEFNLGALLRVVLLYLALFLPIPLMLLVCFLASASVLGQFPLDQRKQHKCAVRRVAARLARCRARL